MGPVIPKEKTCCFTGHRPSKLPWRNNEQDPRCRELGNKLYDIAEALYESGIRHYICGMAQGCDTYFAEVLIKLRDEYKDITLEAALPCETQAMRWSEADRNRYYRLVSEFDYETMVSRQYTPSCMVDRNKYMVDSSSVLIAVFDGSFGGTMQTINYAKKSGLEIIELRP